MNWYNGFSPEVRTRALTWMNRQAIPKPAVCCACGQTEGTLHYHAEDYSEPFGPHIYQFPVCYRCHMMIHCRFKNKAAWNMYRLMIAEGHMFAPLTWREWDRFKREMLVTDFDPWQYISRFTGERPPSRVLDEIDLGVYLGVKDHQDGDS